MNTIPAATQRMTRTSSLAGKAGMKATGMPDFALLLGMTVSLNEQEQKMAGQAGGAVTAMGAATGGEGSAAPVMGVLNINKTDEDASAKGEDATGTPLAELMNAQAAASTLATGQQQAPPAKNVIQDETVKSRAARSTASMATNTTTNAALAAKANPEATGAGVKTWNVRELAAQIRAAMGTVAQQKTTAQSANAAAIPQQAAKAASFLPQAEGDKIRSAGVNRLLQSALNEKKQDTPLAIQPAAPQPGASIQALSQQLAGGPGVDMKNQQAVAAMATAATQAESDETSPGAADTEPATAAAGNTAAPLTWTPEPVVTATQETRMPSMIEQVSQMADFLAERTDGVVKMGKDGVEANLKLYPPDLGGVRVQLNVMSDRTTQAQFIVERPETAQLLQQHMRSFQQGLESHGLTVDRVQVTVQQTVRPSAGGAESGWRQNGNQDMRREASAWRERQGQSSGRNGRSGGKGFGEA